jgi:hypothetical protein
MDYAFAPGVEQRLKMLQQLLRDRTDGAGGTLDTKLIDAAGVTTVRDFLVRVDTTEPLPTGDLVLGSHGNETGWLEIDLDSAAARTVSYKVLKEAWDDVTRRNRLRIPPDMYTTSQGQREPVRVLIKGCRVGQAPKFVDGLTMLFGGKIPVIAPKHFYSVRPIYKTRKKRKKTIIVANLGSFEHLVYSNEIVSPTELKRPALLAAFRAKGFQQFDATSTTPSPIPDLWDTWLPKAAKNLGVGKRPIGYTVSLGRTIEKFTTLPGGAEFRHSKPKITVPITNPPAAVKTKAGFKAALAARPEYQPGWGPTGFPVHEQYGHATFDAFFASFTWTPPKKLNSDPFIWVGERHEYNVLLPVVEPPMTGKATDKLIYNYFPPRGAGGTTIIELLESEAGLFYVSPGAP